MLVKLGTGVLTWTLNERRSDRYGTVWLMSEGDNSLNPVPAVPQPITIPKGLIGTYGQLSVKITASRESTHVGDLFWKVFPEKPDVGEEFPLGTGELFVETQERILCVGVRPDMVDSPWLDMRKLYRAHEQSVELYFTELPREVA